MNQTPQMVQELLKNPPQELQQLLDDSRTPDSARKAVQELQVSSVVSDAAGNKDGPAESSRLQIVNENQEFTYVFLCLLHSL